MNSEGDNFGGTYCVCALLEKDGRERDMYIGERCSMFIWLMPFTGWMKERTKERKKGYGDESSVLNWLLPRTCNPTVVTMRRQGNASLTRFVKLVTITVDWRE